VKGNTITQSEIHKTSDILSLFTIFYFQPIFGYFFNLFREISRLSSRSQWSEDFALSPLSQDAAKAKKKPTELALHKVRIKSHELSRGSARSASADLRVRRSNAPGMAAGWLELPIQPILTVT